MPVFFNVKRYIDKKLSEVNTGEGGAIGSLLKVPTASNLPTTATDGDVAVVLDVDQIYLYDASTSKWVATGISGSGFSQADADALYSKLGHTHTEFTTLQEQLDNLPDSLTQSEADTLYAPISHDHTEYITENEADTKYALKGEGGTGTGGASIDDNTVSTATTFSSQKITDELEGKADTFHEHSEYLTQTETDLLYATKTELADKADVTDFDNFYNKTESDEKYALKDDVIPTYADTDAFPVPTIEGQAVIDESTGLIYVAKTVATTPGVASPSDISLIPKMTKNNLPSPYVAWASKELSSTNTAAYKAFDQMSDTDTINNYFWTGNSRGTAIDWLAVGRTDQKMTFNRISVESSAAGGTNYPASATVQISDNQVDWVDVMNVPNMGLTAGDQVYIIDLPETVSAKYVRLYNLRAVGYSGGSGPVVKEVKIIKSGGLQWVEADYVKKIKNRTRIEALTTNAMTITTNTRQVVTFDNVGVDSLAEYDKTTYKATIKQSGYYRIDAQLWLTYLAQGRYAIGGILINSLERRLAQIVGQQLIPSDGSTGYPAPQTLSLRENVWLNAGDTIQVYIQCDCKSGDTTSISNTSTTRLAINRLY